MISTKKEWFQLKRMTSTKKNDFHQKEWFAIKVMIYTKRIGYHYK